MIWCILGHIFFCWASNVPVFTNHPFKGLHGLVCERPGVLEVMFCVCCMDYGGRKGWTFTYTVTYEIGVRRKTHERARTKLP